MPGIGEVLAYDPGEDPCCGPDPYPGYRDQDQVKKVGLHHRLDLGSELAALVEQPGELFGQDRHYGGCSFGANDHDGLLGRGGEDLLSQGPGQSGCVLTQPGAHMPGTAVFNLPGVG